MNENESLKKEAINLLSSNPTKETLMKLITWIDLKCVDLPLESLPRQILARSVIAAGLAIETTNHGDRLKTTIDTACDFALSPTYENLALFVGASTNSYPFGPGDGCHSVSETGFEGCEVGSGCRSGAGTLNQVAYKIGSESLMKVIAEDLLPWLNGEYDVVARREAMNYLRNKWKKHQNSSSESD